MMRLLLLWAVAMAGCLEMSEHLLEGPYVSNASFDPSKNIIAVMFNLSTLQGAANGDCHPDFVDMSTVQGPEESCRAGPFFNPAFSTMRPSNAWACSRRRTAFGSAIRISKSS